MGGKALWGIMEGMELWEVWIMGGRGLWEVGDYER